MEYAILTGIGVSLFTTLLKALSKRYGLEWGRFLSLGFVFLVSLIVAAAAHFTPEPIWQEVITVFSSAIAFYEAVYKNVVVPADKR